VTHGILKEDNKRYGNSYIFIEELLLSGGIFLILSTIFNDLEFLSKILVTAYLLITAPAAVTKLVINTAYKYQISKAIPRDERPNIFNNASNKTPAAVS
jgi:hypothetical protein